MKNKKIKYIVLGILVCIWLGNVAIFRFFKDNISRTENQEKFPLQTSDEPPECEIEKLITNGSSDLFDPENIKFDDDIYDETTFGGGYGENIHLWAASEIIDYEGDDCGTTDDIGIHQALRDDDDQYLFVGTSWNEVIMVHWGSYTNFDQTIHQYLEKIVIKLEVMPDAFLLGADPGLDIRFRFFDNHGTASHEWIIVPEADLVDEAHYTITIIIEGGTIFDHVKLGYYIEEMQLYMLAYGGLGNPVWLNLDYVDIYYFFDEPDINFEYQFNCSEYDFENIAEFSVDLDIIETVGDLNINFWNFKTSQWDNISQISSPGSYSYNILINASDYFGNDELFIIGFEQTDYWDGRPYSDYKVKIDFIQIKIPPPDPPPDLEATLKTLQICLTWSDSCTHGAPVLYYNIYRGENGGETTLIAVSNSTEFCDSDIEVAVNYTYEVSAVSYMGESDRSFIEITSEDTANPLWNPEPEDQIVELGDPLSYGVNADDISPVTYSINDTTHFAINSETGLITNAKALSVGVYWLEITVEDNYGYVNTTSLKITVEDTTNPEWNLEPEDKEIGLGYPFSYGVNADDLSPVTYSIDDTTHFAINSETGLITNATALTIGVYRLEITAEDQYHNNISTVIQITVYEIPSHQPPLEPSAIPGFETPIVLISIVIILIGIIIYIKKEQKI